MGSNCSSGHRDPDSSSAKSEDSPSYQAASKTKDISQAKISAKAPSEVSVTPLCTAAQDKTINNVNPPAESHFIKEEPSKNETKDIVEENEQEDKPEARYKEKKIVLYVCAADSEDYVEEKKLLRDVIFPSLRSKYFEKGFDLTIIDLHWLSDQESIFGPSAEPHLHELSRQTGYLVPVVFLSSTLGQPILPRTIESSDFNSVSSSPGNVLLKKWYTSQIGAVPPCYALIQPSSLITDLKSLDQNAKETAVESWKSERSALLDSLLEAFPTSELRDSYIWTVIEMEVQRTVLMSKETSKRCIWLGRSSPAPHISSSDDKLQNELNRRLEALKKTLKNELQESNVLKLSKTTEYMDKVKEGLQKRIESIIENIFEECEAEKLDPLLEECRCHRIAQNELSRSGVNRKSTVQHILQIVRTSISEVSPPIVLLGPAGSGKSVLCAKIGKAAKNELSVSPKIIFRSVNLTPNSSSPASLLYWILSELRNGPGQFKSLKLEDLAKEFESILKELSESGQQILLILDGLDQIKFGSKQCSKWIPSQLPKGVQLIVSGRNSNLENEFEGKGTFIQVEQLTVEEAEQIKYSSSLEISKEIMPRSSSAHLDAPVQVTSPLELKIQAWASAWCHNRTSLSKINELLIEIEDILGSKQRTEFVLSCLVMCKYGLRDSEALDLLSSNDLFQKEGQATIFWSEVNRILKLFIQSVNSIVSISCPSLITAVLERYPTQKVLPILYNYFMGQPDSNYRKMSELPYLSWRAFGSASKFNMSHKWVLNKLQCTSVLEVLQDLELTEESDDKTNTLIDFYESHYIPLMSDPTQLYSLLKLYPRSEKLPEDWKSAANAPPIPSLFKVNYSRVSENDDMDETIQYNIVRRIKGPGEFVVSVSTSAGEISVWNSVRCTRIRRLTSLNHPSSIEFIDRYKIVVLCDRELFIYDLNSGSLLIKLQGLMNQKMPYFGLHDSNHLVTLARSRMYVNLINITSGDCVTMFKAGEDRFLNSLLVSEDGKTLVCGDETQKPFPLLVWNLASRKLLYDLRIPQHEFISKLSAITPSGSYVCCVAKEVVDNSPNYIVVYDLQSGTMFKKWKPPSETTSVQLSSTENILVSGHASSDILCWSLGTGNLKYTLKGHSASVSNLRLSPSGEKLLSWTGTSVDRAIRLWNLASGQQLCVFTPLQNVISADLTDSTVTAILDKESVPLCLILVGPGLKTPTGEKEYDER